MELSFFIFLTVAIALGVYLGTHPRQAVGLLTSIVGLIIVGGVLIVIIGIAIWGISSWKSLVNAIPDWVYYVFLGSIFVYWLYAIYKDFREKGVKKAISSYMAENLPTLTNKPKRFLFIVVGLPILVFVILPILLALFLVIFKMA